MIFVIFSQKANLYTQKPFELHVKNGGDYLFITFGQIFENKA